MFQDLESSLFQVQPDAGADKVVGEFLPRVMDACGSGEGKRKERYGDGELNESGGSWCSPMPDLL